MSGPLPFSAFTEQITALKESVSGDALREAVERLVGDAFDASTAKVHGYLAAGQLFREDPFDLAYFNTLSLGNWLLIAAEAGVEAVPARILSAVPTQALFSDAMGNARPEHFREPLEALDDAIQTIRDDEMLRFDPCGSSALKASISEGRGELVGESRGYIKSHNGHIDHILCKRLADAFLWHPEDHMPVFARPIIRTRKRGGWAFHTGAAGQWPCEWRVYVREGEIIGVSNYYPQAAAPADDIPMAMLAVEKTQTLLDTMSRLKIVPHHSRYEGALDTDKASFSADFIEREDGELLFLEGGPTHIFRPAFGASPCCFNPNDGISGIALAPGVVLPLENVNTNGIDKPD